MRWVGVAGAGSRSGRRCTAASGGRQGSARASSWWSESESPRGAEDGAGAAGPREPAAGTRCRRACAAGPSAPVRFRRARGLGGSASVALAGLGSVGAASDTEEALPESTLGTAPLETSLACRARAACGWDWG